MEIYFGKDHLLEEGSPCPVCGQKLDGAMKASPEEEINTPPKVGDFSICVYCASLNRYETHSRLVVATRDDLRELQKTQPKEFEMLQKLLVAAHELVRNRRRSKYQRN